MVRGAGIGLGVGSRFTDADAVAAVEAACPGIDLSGTLDVTGTVTFDTKLNVETITSTIGTLTLSPATDTIISNNSGLAVGFVSILQVSTLSEFGVYGTGDSDSGIIGARYSADASGPVLALGKSRGCCIDQNCIVQDNDTVGTIVFAAADGGNMNTNLARITGEVDDCCPVANSIGGALIFHTSAGAASDDITERMRINAAGDIILPDGSSTTGALALGAGADSRLYYDGTDTFLDLRATGTGDLMIALAGSFPSPDPETVHIWRGSAGTADPFADVQLLIEDNVSSSFGILIPNTTLGGLIIGDPESNIAGVLVYDHSTDAWLYRINAVLTLSYAANAFAFQQATTISAIGDLTLDAIAGSNVVVSAPLNYGPAVSLTIATGVVAITTSYHTLVVEGGAGSGADTLVTATGGENGDILVLKPTTSGANDQVTVQDGTGADTFILSGGTDFVMDHLDDRLTLIHNGTEWVEQSQSNNS